MFKKWAPFHTHIQFVLQKHWCRVSLRAPQPTLFISCCEDNCLELRMFFLLIDVYTFPNQSLEQGDRIKRKYRDIVSALYMSKQ